MMKIKGTEGLDGKIQLPEAMIQLIQSFMNREEAARTTILSKSWNNAYLTRPVLEFDDRDYRKICPWIDLQNYAMRTMGEYRTWNHMIDRFKLRYNTYPEYYNCSVKYLVATAMEIGANDVQLEIGLPENPSTDLPLLSLPRQVLESETLLRLSLTRFRVFRNLVSCSRLKSLTLDHVEIFKVDTFKDIVSCCISIEELSLSKCTVLERPGLKHMILFELHKLRRLYLDSMDVDDVFFSKFESRFPCLKDLSIHDCHGCRSLHIASTSLQTISFKLESGSPTVMAKFDVPSIRKFTYSGSGLPSLLSINGASTEWELHISMHCNRLRETSWFLNLKESLSKFSLSRISLSLILKLDEMNFGPEHIVDTEVVPEPLVVENLIVYAPSRFRSALLIRLLGIFRPKFITHDHNWLSAHYNLWNRYNLQVPLPFDMFHERPIEMQIACTSDMLHERLVEILMTRNCQSVFGNLGLKKVNVEAYKLFGSEWLPIGLEGLETSRTPANHQKIRLQLEWEDS